MFEFHLALLNAVECSRNLTSHFKIYNNNFSSQQQGHSNRQGSNRPHKKGGQAASDQKYFVWDAWNWRVQLSVIWSEGSDGKAGV